MRRITFKKLSIQNFLSIGNDTIEIDFQNGLNLITGTNIDNPERRNGTGKSAIIEGFYYALFGTTIRDIKKEFVINNVTKGKGRVDLFLDIQTDTGTNSYKISRQLKPSTVELYKLGDKEEDISKDSIANTNKYICDLIGSNPVICKSCDILSLSDNTPFMAKKPEEKRKFIEDVFALEIFGKMLKDLKELIKENKNDSSISNAKLEEIENNLSTLTEQYESQKKKNSEREKNLKNRKEEILKSIEDTKKKISDVVLEKYDIQEVLKYNNALKQVNDKIKKIDEQILLNRGTLKSLKDELSNVCNVEVGVKCSFCLQDIPHTHFSKLESLTKEITDNINELEYVTNPKLQSERKEWDTKKTKLENKIDEYQQIFNDNQIKSFQISSYESDIKNFERQLEVLEGDIGHVVESLDSFIENIEKTKKRKDEQLEIYNELKQKSEDLEVCKFIFGEEGIKSFIIKRLLDMLNASIQKYITSLGMTMKCKFDEYFDEKITNDKGKEISYWNLSGGERKTVDIACAWAFKDIKKKISGISSNVEFLDELLDSAVDERGVDLLIEVLKERIDKNSLSCYVISHRKETLKHITGEIVELKKENSITTRIS